MELKKQLPADCGWSRMAQENAQRREAEEKRRQEEQRKREVEWEARMRRRKLEELHAYSPEYFMESGDSFLHDPRGCISSRELYDLYCRWCENKALLPHPQRVFLLYVSKHAARYQIHHSSNIPLPGGGHVNGYLGIRCLTEEERNARG